MKILTMCQGGQVRSVGLKYLLRYKYGHDALACGWEGNTPETRKMLYDWADAIVIMQPGFRKHIPGEYKKVFCYDVGPDSYGYAFHPELQSKLDAMIKKHGAFNA